MRTDDTTSSVIFSLTGCMLCQGQRRYLKSHYHRLMAVKGQANGRQGRLKQSATRINLKGKDDYINQSATTFKQIDTAYTFLYTCRVTDHGPTRPPAK